MSAEDALPAATCRRWQPLRGGLLNLFRFDYEEFHYEQGHLLLRGNNGAGKSRVLALQLPFLLDGEVASHRLEPDGDPAKRVEWNLLMGRHADRLGYTFLEFGRRDDDGAEHYLTLGCGLRAVEGRTGLAGKWFFVTPQRVGRDLFLQSTTGQALSRERLREALGSEGRLFDTAEEYRGAVDQALFKLGRQRYQALLDLLIRLRQPQLSRQLDEVKLSQALSEALPPLGAEIIETVAESFRSLEDDQQALRGFTAAHAATEAFLQEYQRYAQMAARRRSDRVRVSHSEYEAAQRDLRAATTEHGAAQERLAQKTQEHKAAEVREAAAEGEAQTLAQSPEMQDAQTLERARREATERKQEAERAEGERARAQRSAADLSHKAVRAQERLHEARAESARLLSEAEAQATKAALAPALRAVAEAAGLATGEALSEAALRRAERRAQEGVEAQRQAIRRLDELLRKVQQAEQHWREVRRLQEERSENLQAALNEQARAQRQLERIGAELREACSRWLRGLRELAGDLGLSAGGLEGDEAALGAAVDDFCLRGGAGPVQQAARRALQGVTERLSQARAALGERQAEAQRSKAELSAEVARLQAGRDEGPPAPPLRDVAARRGRAGAPLYLLCDFAPELLVDAEAPARAGLEAALWGSGLLDAWVTPDGQVLSAGTNDSALVPGRSPPPAAEASLLRWLRPVAENPIDRERSSGAAVVDPQAAPVDAAVVTQVLGHIGGQRDAGVAWVAADGAWQLGPLHGQSTTAQAQYIGQGARAAARRRRLAALAALLREVEGRIAGLADEQRALQERQQRANAEAAAAPDEGPVLKVQAELATQGEQVRRLRERLEEADGRVAACRQTLDQATRERDEVAADLRLTEHLRDLGALKDAVAGYERALLQLWAALRAGLRSQAEAEEAQARAEEAGAAAIQQGERAHEARKRAGAAQSERDALESTVGVKVAEVLRRLGEARARLSEVRRSKERLAQEGTEIYGELRAAQQRMEHLSARVSACAEARQGAIAALLIFARKTLLLLVAPELSAGQDAAAWSVTRAVEVARLLEERLSAVHHDDRAWERATKALHGHYARLSDALPVHGFAPFFKIEDELFEVLVPFQGREYGMAELLQLLQEEVTQRQAVLSAREREVLENHLIGDVCAHLHDRLREGELWVQRMNTEIGARPTATGMTLRFRWQVRADGPPGAADARRRLLGDRDTWSSAEQRSLGEFLQQQIKRVRAEHEGATWREHLTRALDYRAWHEFQIERQQDGRWVRLTRRSHGTGSGGEKAVALILPQLAAAAAHYASADSRAPRLILQDEAFVGVDPTMRSRCMGLLAAFDLDFLMTSEQEWGCYPTLPGVAICQLSALPGVEAVYMTRWVWNGRERLRDDRPQARAAGEGAAPTS